jgi:NTE family protein
MSGQLRPVAADSGGKIIAPPFGLALQGGGAYGAFAWGVLDRLLEEDGFHPAALSGASAGALNAAMMVHGQLAGGREGARTALRQFWEAVGQMALLNPLSLPGADLQFEMLSKVVSPYQFNPLNINPLREFLAAKIDFEAIRRQKETMLFISATDVASGEPRFFREHELSAEVLLASCCIPSVHQAVELDGHAYWDGGFSANPPILPLALNSPCRSLLVVKLTPREEPGAPTAAPEISARLKRILFNTSLQRDLEALAAIRQVIRHTTLPSSDQRRLRDLEIRTISIDRGFFDVSNGSALNPRPDLIERLHQSGRAAADDLLSNHG